VRVFLLLRMRPNTIVRNVFPIIHSVFSAGRVKLSILPSVSKNPDVISCLKSTSVLAWHYASMSLPKLGGLTFLLDEVRTRANIEPRWLGVGTRQPRTMEPGRVTSVTLTPTKDGTHSPKLWVRRTVTEPVTAARVSRIHLLPIAVTAANVESASNCARSCERDDSHHGHDQ
jgi:hypothetical protein